MTQRKQNRQYAECILVGVLGILGPALLGFYIHLLR